MATTITTSNLTVATTESITLNGTTYNQTITKTVADIQTVSKRTITLTANTTHSLATLASTATNDSFDTEDVKYIRVTNLDDTNVVILTLAASATSGAVEIPALGTQQLFTVNVNGAASKAAITSVGAIETIFVHNAHASATVDIEIFIASV